MLDNGLQQKRGQAELALTVTPSNWLEVREQLTNMKQGQFRRLDAVGMARALLNTLSKKVTKVTF